jgi:hypothetical protein
MKEKATDANEESANRRERTVNLSCDIVVSFLCLDRRSRLSGSGARLSWAQRQHAPDSGAQHP